MATQFANGHFNAAGDPCLNFRIAGNGTAPGLDAEAVIDTGFSGFVLMPVAFQVRLGLPTASTTEIILADASRRPCVVSTATVTFNNASRVGVITFEPNTQEILIGMDFLRQFNLALFISSTSIVLVDERMLPPAPAAP